MARQLHFMNHEPPCVDACWIFCNCKDMLLVTCMLSSVKVQFSQTQSREEQSVTHNLQMTINGSEGLRSSPSPRLQIQLAG